MVFDIKLEHGFWTVNGKKLEELDTNGQEFMNRFFREMKIENPLKNKKPEVNPLVKRVYHRDEEFINN